MTSDTAQTLEQLPDAILSRIIGLLPQQAKVDLSLCSYRLYQLVQPELYRHLLFTLSTSLKSKHDFRDSLATVIGGSSNCLTSRQSQQLIYQTRQEVLLQSLTVNPQLCTYVQKVTLCRYNGKELVMGDETKDTEQLTEIEAKADPAVDPELLEYLKQHCKNIVEFATLGSGGLSQNDFKLLPNLTRADINDPTVDIGGNIKTLVLNAAGLSNKRSWKVAQRLGQLETLEFNDDIVQAQVLNEWDGSPLKLKTLKIVFYHGFNDANLLSRQTATKLLDAVDTTTLTSLEFVLGCDHMSCNCLKDLIDDHILQRDFQLTRLAFKQQTLHRDQNYSEKFDFYVCNVLTRLPHPELVKYLCVSHHAPQDFNSGNGFEGNFIKRKKLWHDAASSLPNVETLVFPHFVEFTACFEQVISNMLWNGCKCDHCSSYLSIFDRFIMRHQYYDGLVGYVTDLISPVLFGTAGRVLSTRLVTQDGDLNCLRYPPLDKYWDLHENSSVVHFKGSKEEEACEFNQGIFQPLATCLSHFLLDYVKQFSESLPRLQLAVMSGEYFDRDSEAGTWTCAYD